MTGQPVGVAFEAPDGWTVWHEDPGGRLVLAFRPDVFDAGEYPPACLPTITVGPGSTPDQPFDRRVRSAEWHVALYLEPTVRVRAEDATFGDRGDAVDAAVDLASRFAAGHVDYRPAYLDPRAAYLDRLDALTGREG